MGKLRWLTESPGEGKFIFTIEEQPEDLTMFIKSRRNQAYRTSNGWTVAIDVEPQVNIDDKTIYLRGSDGDADDKIDRHWGLTSKQVKKVINDVDRALEDAFAAAKSWVPSKTIGLERVIYIDASRYDPFYSFRRNPRIIILD
jgi:hypothetical protein